MNIKMSNLTKIQEHTLINEFMDSLEEKINVNEQLEIEKIKDMTRKVFKIDKTAKLQNKLRFLTLKNRIWKFKLL